VIDKKLLDNLQQTEDTLIEIRNFLISLKSQCDFLYLISENICELPFTEVKGFLLQRRMAF